MIHPASTAITSCSRICHPNHLPSEQQGSEASLLCMCSRTFSSGNGIGHPTPPVLPAQGLAQSQIGRCGGFATVDDMIAVLNETLKKAPDFATVPPINDDHEIFTYTASAQLPYKTCPETDAEELAHVADQQKSIIEVIGKHEEPLWKDHVQAQVVVQASLVDQRKMVLGWQCSSQWKRLRSRQCRWKWICSRMEKKLKACLQRASVETPLDWCQLTPANLDESFHVDKKDERILRHEEPPKMDLHTPR